LELSVKQSNYRRFVNFCARLCLGLVFIVAAVSKSLDLNHFAQQVGDFGLVYDSLVMPTAWAIVLAELLVGISLVFQRWGSLASAIALLLLFIGVLTYGIALGLDVECGCFGVAVHVSLGSQLLTDFGLLSICAIIYWTADQRGAPRIADELTEHEQDQTR
jgi:uncharacterized membrane protein YphA (DoxX/SURF4 family)